MKRPNVIYSCLSVCWVGAALIATSWLASASQSNAPLQPPPPPPKSTDRKASPLHAFDNTVTQQQDESNRSNYARSMGASTVSEDNRRPPPPPQRPDVSSRQQRHQQNQISAPPPRIQSSTGTPDMNNFTQTQKKPLETGVEGHGDRTAEGGTITLQKTQQPPPRMRPLHEPPARPVAPNEPQAMKFVESNRLTPSISESGFRKQEDRLEPRPLSPPVSNTGSGMRIYDRGTERPPTGVPPRPDMTSTYQQPHSTPPPRPGTFQTPRQHDPREGPQMAGQNRRFPHPNGPPGNRQVQQKRQPSPQAWTKLWKRVERGLDGLADLEDVVTERAQQLYSTAKESVSAVYKRPSDPNADNDQDLISSSTISPIRIWSKSRSKPQTSSPIPQMDMSRFTKKIATEEEIASEKGPTTRKDKLPWENTASSSDVPTSPYTNAMIKESGMARETTHMENNQKAATSLGQGITKSSPDNSGNTTSRMIRANGGASTPPYGGPTHPQQNDPQVQSQAPLERSMTPMTRPLPSRNTPPVRRAPRETPWPVQKKSFVDDEEEGGSVVQRMIKALPGIPLVPKFSFFRRNRFDTSAAATWDAWNADDGEASEASPGFFGRIFKSKAIRRSTSQASSQPAAKFMSPPLQSFMERCDNGKTLSLLNPSERIGSRRIGRTLATLDVVALVFALIGLKQLPKLDHITFPHSVSEALSATLPRFVHCFVSGMDTWAPFAFLAAFLTIQTRQLIFKAKLTSLSQTLDANISEEAQYGALFLRLYTSSTYIRDISDRIRAAARSQLTARVDLTRLRALVTIFLTSMLVMTVPVVTPLLVALFGTLQHILGLEPLHSWPPKWNALMESIVSSWASFASKATELISEELAHMSDHPKQVVFGLSIAGALALVSLLAGTGRHGATSAPGEIEEDEDAQFTKFTEQVSNLGVSSASRIALLSDVGGIDSALERWRLLFPRGAEVAYTRKSLRSIFHILGKGAASAILLSLPLLLQHYYGFSLSSTSNSFPSWGSLIDVSTVLLLTQLLSWKAMSSSLVADECRGAVSGFVTSLRKATNERLSRLNSPPLSLQQQVSISPSAGLEVKDLWAAHTTKRAWAVRGVSLECRNGNVLLILGDDSAGKSRLLTALAEAISCPPPQALTTTRVRGSIRVAGVELNRWDSKLLQKRVWSVLHDVRSMSDFAQILSGMSLEEILEPSGGIRYLELSHRPGPNERATMMLALKLTGLYSSLLPKLPSKLSTVVTANEEDVRPSALRPLYSMLSPAEWSKLLLARVFSQAIYENENAASTNESLENCLIGSLLLLDDATLYLPEVEEARMLRDLRTTGAATVMTSNRWALGRLADQIVVMRDGAVVESGTHAELLSRGPQQSLYAAKWHAMTSQ